MPVTTRLTKQAYSKTTKVDESERKIRTLAPFIPSSCREYAFVKIRSWSFNPPYLRTGVSRTVAKCLRPRGRAKPDRTLNEHLPYNLRDSRAALVACSICQCTANKDDTMTCFSEGQRATHLLDYIIIGVCRSCGQPIAINRSVIFHKTVT